MSTSDGKAPPTNFLTASAAPLRNLLAVHVDAAHARLRGERDELGVGQFMNFAAADAILLLGEHDDAAAFGRFIGQRRELRGVGQFIARPRRERERTQSPGGCRA